MSLPKRRVDEASVPPGGTANERAGWLAALALAFDRTAGGTRLASRLHAGPLLVQRALYPEGPEVCHAIIVHPPGGIAGGDRLEIDIAAGANAHALLTTPGATRLYKSAGRTAAQSVRLRAGARACIEWLPQESIVFDAADATLALDVDVAPDAVVLAWDIVTLGREAMGERFASGRLRTRLTVRQAGRIALHERGDVAGGAPWLDSPVGWQQARACGTFVVAGRAIDDALLEAGRDAIAGSSPVAAVSRVTPTLLVARYLGPTAAGARAVFAALWRQLRPPLVGRVAQPPRIWST